MKLTRRTILTSSAAFAVAAATGSAKAADFTLKIASDVPMDHPVNVALAGAVERIRQASNGKLDAQIFPSSQLGGDTDMLSQTRMGAIDIFACPVATLANVVPVVAINSVGFAFSGYDKVWPTMDGELGTFIKRKIDATGIIAFDRMWDNGFRQLTSSDKPIKTPKDLAGFKIRVPVSPMWTSMFTALGASPVSMNIGEVYTAMQTRVVDGHENPLVNIYYQKFYEVQKYISLTHHMWDGWWILASRKCWAALPADLQKILRDNINQAALEQRALSLKLDNDLKGVLAKSGVQFITVDQSDFQKALTSAGFYAAWRDKFGKEAWDLLEKSVGKLA